MSLIAGKYANQRSQQRAEDQPASAAALPGSTEQASMLGSEEALVNYLADRIYQRLLQDLKIERERLRLVSLKSSFRKGGR